jgi:branched-chain amino acid transport system substrate-binding protein
MRLATGTALVACLTVAFGVVVAACGSSRRSAGAGAVHASRDGGEVVDIYSSLPMHGPAAAEAAALSDGMRLALAQAGDRAGAFTVKYTALDDSTGSAGWDVRQTATNARIAAADPRAVLYIGELDDGASEVSMPVLNEAGIPQLSPSNTYVGLTVGRSDIGSHPPYAPTARRTYLRIVPTDSVQAGAQLEAMQRAGCAKAALLDDGEPYGAGLAKLVEAQKRSYGVEVISYPTPEAGAAFLRLLTAGVPSRRPDCVLFEGIASKSAVQMTEEIHLALPNARIFAPTRLCTSAWTNPQDGGVPAAIDRLIECTVVPFSPAAYPGGRAFLAAYRASYGGSNPSGYAILGYEAMKLGLSTIARLGSNGDSKSAVLSALFSTTDRHSVLGTYGFDRNGDTTLRSFGLYRVGRNGDPVFIRTITPRPAL